MKVDLKLVPCEELDYDVGERMVVIVDVFRATSVVVTALSIGAKYVLPVEGIDQAFELKGILSDVVLAGERNSLKIEGFDFSNSPLELLKSKEELLNKGMILTTTNGTRAILAHSKAKGMIAASFLNIDTSVDFVSSKNDDLLLVCSGANGRFSMEDFVFCGSFIDRLSLSGKDIELSSGAYVAYKFYKNNVENLKEMIMMGEHTKNLIRLGFGEDVDFCLRENLYRTLAKAGKLRLNGKDHVIFKAS